MTCSFGAHLDGLIICSLYTHADIGYINMSHFGARMAPKELTWDQTLRFRLLEIVLQWGRTADHQSFDDRLQYRPPTGVTGYQPLPDTLLTGRVGL